MNSIAPMLTKLGEKSDLNKKGFISEPKLDGTRAILIKKGKKIQLINRRYRNITYRYPEFKFDKNIKANFCILDGEIVVYKDGLPNFNLLQKRDQLENKTIIELRSKLYPATFVVFDILKLERRDTKKLPLIERKKLLEKIIKQDKTIETVLYTEDIKALWRHIQKKKLEGIVLKKKYSKYYPGKRTPLWLKIKNIKTIDAIIVGYTKEKRKISSLVTALYIKGKLTYIGRVGTGFTEAFIDEFYKKLKKIELKKPLIKIETSKKIHYVKPIFIAEIRFLEFSRESIMRAPVFLRLRTDKLPKDCTLEDQV
ncbi:DNA ligase [Candidatus Woesearchaeota archaeon]|nr:MAG: DNA ligase [Candidatus Woesearchaeota archaeon]